MSAPPNTLPPQQPAIVAVVTPVAPGLNGAVSGSGNLLTPGIRLAPGQDLFVGGNSTTAHVYTLTPRDIAAGASAPTRKVAGGSGAIFKGSQYSFVVIDASDANVVGEVGPEGAFGAGATFRLSASSGIVNPTINLTDAGTFIVQDDAGVAILTLTDGGAGANTVQLGVGLQVYAATAVGNSQVYLSAGTGNVTVIGSDSGGHFAIYATDGGQNIQLRTGGDVVVNQGNLLIQKQISAYNAIATAGIGLPVIYAVGVQTLVTNTAPPALSYTPPATPGVYEFTAGLNIVTGGTLTFRVKATYKSGDGVAQSDIPIFMQQGSTTLLSGGPAANATGRFYVPVWTIPVDNSATAIIVANNAGTYTAGTYFWTPILKQVQ